MNTSLRFELFFFLNDIIHNLSATLVCWQYAQSTRRTYNIQSCRIVTKPHTDLSSKYIVERRKMTVRKLFGFTR